MQGSISLSEDHLALRHPHVHLRRDMIKEAHPLLARVADLAEHVTWGDEQAQRIPRAIDDHVPERGMGL